MNEREKAGASGSINRRDLLKAAVVAPTAALVQLRPAVGAAFAIQCHGRGFRGIRAEGL